MKFYVWDNIRIKYNTSCFFISIILLFIVFLLQFLSGILLSIYYNDFFIIAFDTIIYLVLNINIGWFIRVLHIIGASLFILFIMLHFIRFIWIIVKLIYVQCLFFILIITGYLLFVFSMIEAFLGYILCWDQMSYWIKFNCSYLLII